MQICLNNRNQDQHKKDQSVMVEQQGDKFHQDTLEKC